jgi:hypothetical protein
VALDTGPQRPRHLLGIVAHGAEGRTARA